MKIVQKTDIPAVFEMNPYKYIFSDSENWLKMKLTYQFNISCRTSEGKADVPSPDFETMHLLKLPLGYRITYM